MKFNIVQSLGSSFFQNMGLLAVFAILFPQWAMGKYLETDVTISMLSMVYFVFFAVNVLTFFALVNVSNFLAIL